MKRNKVLITAHCIFTLLCLAIAGVSAAEVTGRIVDAATGQPIAARIYVRGQDGRWYFPRSSAAEGTAYEYQRQVSPQSLEMHTTLSAHPFRLDLPTGQYELRVLRGKEYLPLVKQLEVADEPLEVELAMTRWINMAERGWYSGDVHLHRSLAETKNLVLAEDLNVAFPLSHWVTLAHTDPVKGNRVEDPPAESQTIAVDPIHLIHPLNTEYEIFTVDGRSHTLGAVLILGQEVPLQLGVPPVQQIAAEARRQNAFLDLEKHSWPWSPVIAPIMGIEGFELANNHCWPTEFAFHQWTIDEIGEFMQLEMNDQGFTEWGWIDFGFKTYYAYLNCGLRLRPTAGTGNGVHPVPAGFGRVYVQLDEPLGVDQWLAGLRAGRSFVTTGPMLLLTVNDQPPGSTIDADETIQVTLSGQVLSAQPLETIEVIVNGDVAHRLQPQNDPAEHGTYRCGIEHRLTLDESSWVAVRVFERHPQQRRIHFAHSSPVHIVIPSAPLRPRRAEVEYFIDRVEHQLQRNGELFNDEENSEQLEALKFYRDLLPAAR